MRALLCLPLLAACGNAAKPLPLSAETTYVETADGGVLEVRATTEPGALVTLLDGGVTADGDGHALFRYEAGTVDSDQLEVTAHKGDRHSDWVNARLAPVLRHKDHWLECYGGTSRCSIMVGLDGLEMGSAWEGMTLEWDGHVATANANGEADLPIDLYRYAGQAPLDETMKTHDSDVAPFFEVPVTVTYGDLAMKGTALADARDMQWAIAHHFEEIANGPVEPALAPTGDAVLIAGLDHGPVLVGAANAVSDLRWIAHVERIDRELGGCGTYETMDDGRRVEVMRATTDLRVTIRERTTGASLAQKTFPGSRPSCDTVVRGDMLVGEEKAGAVVKWVKAWKKR